MAARRFMRHQAGEPVSATDSTGESPELDAAMAEMERVWAFAGAVAGDPRIEAAREADLARFRPDRRMKWAGLVAAMLVLAFASVMMVPLLDRGGGAPMVAHSFSTGVGQRANVTLADASRVTLDTDSAIAVRLDEDARAVTLQRGRAYFEVAKDASRPFTVEAGDKRVRATGTAFSVEIDEGEVIVIVTEGAVEVTERGEGRAEPLHSAEMTAGTELVADGGSDWMVRRVDPAQSTSWTIGRLTFMSEPLADAVAEMNRYATQKLVFRDGRIPDERIVGVFQAGDTEALAQAIELNDFARIVQVTPDRIEVHSAPKAKP